MLLRAVAIRHDRRQTPVIGGCNFDGDASAHVAKIRISAAAPESSFGPKCQILTNSQSVRGKEPAWRIRTQ